MGLDVIVDILKHTVGFVDIPPPMNETILRKKTKSSFDVGNERIDLARKMLMKYDEIKNPRSIDQVIICERMLRALALLFYQDCFEFQKEEIMRRNRWEFIFPMYVLEMPRRGGKSEMLSLVLTIMFLIMPKLKILIVTPVSAQGSKESGIQGKVEDMLLELFNIQIKTSGSKSRNNKSSKNMMALFHEGSRREIYSKSKK